MRARITIKREDISPGPGAYDITEKKIKKKGGKFSKAERLKSASTIGPGPGNYNYDQTPIRVKKPLYSFGGKHYTIKKKDESTPGPGAYDPKDHKAEGPKITMGAKIKIATEENKNDIGPGQYDPNEDIRHWKAPEYSMPGRYEDKKKVEEGPGFLYPNIDLTREKKPEWGMGKEERRDLSKVDIVPGVGEYNCLFDLRMLFYLFFFV